MSRPLTLLLCASFFLHAEDPQLLLTGELIAPLSDQNLSDEVVFSESLTSLPLPTSLGEPVSAAPLEIKKMKNPFIAVFLSSLVPGGGHYYLGETRVANEILGGTALGSAAIVASRNDPALFVTSIHMTKGIGFYSLFAAYRDTKLYNGNALAGMPRESFKDLSAASFQWSVLKKPEVWGGFLGALSAGAALTYFAYPKACAHIETAYVEPLSALPIAIGEESIFRGLLQTALLEEMPPWGAITLSSVLFGAAHIPNAMTLEAADQWRYYAFSVPFITTLGAYMGWLTYKNHSLKESVALHAWYDFALMSLGVIANQAVIGGQANLTYGFEF